MLRRNILRFKPVPYASLFGYNKILSSVFTASGERPCLRVEVPGHPTESYTYHELQRDVVALADRMARTMSADGNKDGMYNGPRLTLQVPRSPDVKGLFHTDTQWPSTTSSTGTTKRQYSVDALHDNGSYNVAILVGPSYEYVLSMLAVWSLGLMVVPMSPSHHYEGEMTHMLEHSASRLLVTQEALLSSKLPASYGELAVQDATARNAPADGTFRVGEVLNVTEWLRQHRDQIASSNNTTLSGNAEEETVVVELLPPVEARKKTPRTAEEVLSRLKEERQDQADKERAEVEDLLWEDFKRQAQHGGSGSSSAHRGVPPISFDDAKVDALNPIFAGRWAELLDEQQQQTFRGATTTTVTSPVRRFLPTQEDDCLMIYTSGTTAKPKGVVHSHASVCNQVSVLQDAWRWSDQDTILHTLPLHHVHGIVNVLLCALASHALCIFTPFDNAGRIARRLDQGDVSLFMGVPTMYARLIDAVGKGMSPIEQTGWRKAVSQNVRLMVSGSAALPVPVLQRFHELSGHTLLERYGMTEVGMALSQPYTPIAARLPGTVGTALPTVETLISNTKETEDDDTAADTTKAGALALRSASLFDRYNPKATKGELTIGPQGAHYFETGDTVGVVSAVPAGKDNEKQQLNNVTAIQILGRTSVDIIKHKGYKLSALEIEAALLQDKDAFREVAVFGVPRADVGEVVVAVVVLADSARDVLNLTFSNATDEHETFHALDAESNTALRNAALRHLAAYKAPTKFVVVKEIPRNAMGKVNKKDLRKQIASLL